MKKLLSIIVLAVCSFISIFAVLIVATLVFSLIQTIYNSSRALFWIVIFFGGSFGLAAFGFIIPFAADLTVRASQKISLSKTGLRYTVMGILIILLYGLNLIGQLVNNDGVNLASAILSYVLLVFFSIVLIIHGRETAKTEYTPPILSNKTQDKETVGSTTVFAQIPTSTSAGRPIQNEEHFSSNSNNHDKNIPVDSLKILKELYDSGVLSEEEFSEKKKQLLRL